MASVCRTRLVPDDPAELDLLGPHAPLAHAITGLVETETGGRAVALTGTWGAGKSTVVRLIREQIENSPSRRVWVFDAWAHEGDTLRRTFLESLSITLEEPRGSSRGWVDANRWKEERERLSRRRRDTDEETTPILSLLGRALLSSVFAVPFGLALFGLGLQDGITWRGDPATVNWLLLAGIVLGAAPLLLVIGTATAAWLGFAWQRFARKREVKRPDFGKLLAILSTKGVTTVRSTTIETPEPTSLEFSAIFSELLREALTPVDRSLVIVVDNLDRVDGESALKVWGTLQTFLQPVGVRPAWLDRLWVVMSFDRHSVEKHWRQRDSKDNADLAASFLDKTFQIQFDVPPPLISKWDTYLKAQLQAAFPDHSEAEFHSIYRMVAGKRDPSKRATTPRELKLLVNQIGAIHRQWCGNGGSRHRIPLLHMAYYALTIRDQPEINIPDSLKKGELPNASEASFLGTGIRDDLAAIAFGVEPTIARQLLLEDDVRTALTSGDANRLTELRQSSDAYLQVIETVLDADARGWRDGEAAKIFNAAYALDKADIFSGLSPASLAHSLNALVDGVRLANRPGLPPSSAEGMATLARKTRDPAVAKAILECHQRSLQQLPEERDRIVAAVIVGIQLVIDLRSARLLADDEVTFDVPGGPQAFIPTVFSGHSASLLGDHVGITLEPSGGAEAVVDHIAEVTAGGGFRGQHLTTLRYLQRVHGAEWRTKLAEPIKDRLQAAANATQPEVRALVDAMDEIREAPNGLAVLQALVDSGDLAHHFAALLESDWTAASKAALLMGHARPGWNPGSNVGRSTDGYQQLAQQSANPQKEFVAPLSALISNSEAERFIWELLDARPAARPLVVGILRELSSSSNPGVFFSPAAVFAHWDVFLEAVGAKELVDRVPIDSLLDEFEESGLLVENAEFFEELVGALPSGSAVHIWCAERLRGLDSETWLRHLREEGEFIDLALACASAGNSPQLEAPLREALKDYAGELARGEGNPEPPRRDWQHIVGLLADDYRQTVLDDLYRIMRQHPSTVSDRFFDRFGASLAQAGLMAIDQDAYLEVFEPFVKARNARGIEWIVTQVESGADPFKSIRKAHHAPLRGLLKDESIAAYDDEAHGSLLRLASLLPPRATTAKKPSDKTSLKSEQ